MNALTDRKDEFKDGYIIKYNSTKKKEQVISGYFQLFNNESDFKTFCGVKSCELLEKGCETVFSES